MALQDCPPVGAQLQKIVTSPSAQQHIFIGPEPCTGYFFLNTSLKPFSDQKVRQAVNWVIDKDNLIKLLGGPYASIPGSSILPPGMLGYLPSNKFDPFAGAPNLSKAKQLMKQAGYANGYKGQLLLVGDSTPPVPQMFQSVKQDLAKIGITNLKIKTLPYPDYYTQYLEIPAKHVAAGFAAWCEDFPSPTSFMTPLLYGPSILQQGNSNYSMMNDPELNAAIKKASETTGSAAKAAWEKANRLATLKAPWVPYRWYKARIVVSNNLTNAFFHSYYEWIDWPNVGVKS